MRPTVAALILALSCVFASEAAATPRATQRSLAFMAIAASSPASSTTPTKAMRGRATAPDSTARAAPVAVPAPQTRVRSAPLVGRGSAHLKLRSNIPYWRLGLAGSCALAAVVQEGTSEKTGWGMLGSGLLVWALVDWFIPSLRSKASD